MSWPGISRSHLVTSKHNLRAGFRACAVGWLSNSITVVYATLLQDILGTAQIMQLSGWELGGWLCSIEHIQRFWLLLRFAILWVNRRDSDFLETIDFERWWIVFECSRGGWKAPKQVLFCDSTQFSLIYVRHCQQFWMYGWPCALPFEPSH